MRGLVEEEMQDHLIIKNCSSKCFNMVIEYLYTGSVKSLEIKSNAYVSIADQKKKMKLQVELMAIADQYMLPHLKEICAFVIHQELNIVNASFVLDAAEKYNTPQLRAVAVYFIIRNYSQVHNTEGFLDLDPNVRAELGQSVKLSRRGQHDPSQVGSNDVCIIA